MLFEHRILFKNNSIFALRRPVFGRLIDKRRKKDGNAARRIEVLPETKASGIQESPIINIQFFK